MRLFRLLKKDLATEASTWVDKQLITVDQARAICRLYGVDYDAIGSRSTAYRVLMVLGFLFIGLSVITVIGANWDAIPRGVRMAGLLVLTAGTHGLAMREHLSGRTSSAVGLFFLGNLFYGASIVLVAQIFHLGEHMPEGVFLWALGSLPFAVLLCNARLTLFSGLLAVLWFYPGIQNGVPGAGVPGGGVSAVSRGRGLRAGESSREHAAVPDVRRQSRPVVRNVAFLAMDG